MSAAHLSGSLCASLDYLWIVFNAFMLIFAFTGEEGRRESCKCGKLHHIKDITAELREGMLRRTYVRETDGVKEREENRKRHRGGNKKSCNLEPFQAGELLKREVNSEKGEERCKEM